MIRALRCAALVLAFGTGHVSAQAENPELAARIEAGLNAIWPAMDFEVAFRGCTMTVRREAPAPEPWITTESWWLADLITDPREVTQDHQRMSDGQTTWVMTNIVFRVKPTVQETVAADLRRFQDAHEAIWVQSERGSLLRWLGLASFDRYDALQGLQRKRVAGHFGNIMARNQGVAWMHGDPKGTFELAGLIDGPPGFTFRDDVRDAILTDLHSHAMTACP